MTRPWKKTFTALRHPNYRLWFQGQTVSLLGSWMQTTAMGFLAFELTRSPAFLGWLGFAGGLPTWFFMLYGGVVADRVPRRSLLVITQSILMLLAAWLAVLVFTGWVRPVHLVIIAVISGITNSFDAPTRQAFVHEMIDPEDMTNAIALNSTMFNLGTTLGPAAAGIIYAAFGPGWCFALNAFSFLAVLTALLRMQLKPFEAPEERGSHLEDMKEGLVYAARHPLLRALIVTIAVVSLFGMSYVTLIPAWTVKILHGGSRLNGFLHSARGLGALAGALAIASLGRRAPRGKLLLSGVFAFPLMLLLISFNTLPLLAVAMFLGVGVSIIFIYNLANSLIQTLSPESLRGRVMSFYTLTFFGFTTLGALWAGQAAAWWGEANAVRIGAAVTLVGAAFLRWRVPRLWREQ